MKREIIDAEDQISDLQHGILGATCTSLMALVASVCVHVIGSQRWSGTACEKRALGLAYGETVGADRHARFHILGQGLVLKRI